VNYTAVVDGEFTGAEGLTGSDSYNSTTATGTVYWGSDAYNFTGNITYLTIDGNASAYVDGEETDTTD
jgi:hypothetical protein